MAPVLGSAAVSNACDAHPRAEKRWVTGRDRSTTPFSIKADGARPRVAVAVLELQIDLAHAVARMNGIWISFLPTPMTKTLPPNLTAQMAAAMLLSTPVHSRASVGSMPPKLWTMDLAGVLSGLARSTLWVITSGQISLAKRRVGPRQCQ